MRMNMGCVYLLCFCMECVSCLSAWSVSLVHLHGPSAWSILSICMSICMECVSCLSAWSVSLVHLHVCVVHMWYVVFTYGCMLIGCVVCTCDMWNLSHLKSYYMYGWFYSGVEYSKSLKY